MENLKPGSAAAVSGQKRWPNLLPGKLADAQVARWQSKYGREPTLQQRTWLANKIRTDIAMTATNFETQRPGHHQEPPEHAREVIPAHGCAEKDGTRLGVSGLGPPASARQGTTHGRTFLPHRDHRVAVVVGPSDGHDPQRTQLSIIELRFIKFNLASRAYQTKLSPLEGLARH